MEQEADRKILWKALEDHYGLNEMFRIMKDPRAYHDAQQKPGPIWDTIMGCWLFRHKGMMMGVETDGYIHS